MICGAAVESKAVESKWGQAGLFADPAWGQGSTHSLQRLLDRLKQFYEGLRNAGGAGMGGVLARRA